MTTPNKPLAFEGPEDHMLPSEKEVTQRAGDPNMAFLSDVQRDKTILGVPGDAKPALPEVSKLNASEEKDIKAKFPGKGLFNTWNPVSIFLDIHDNNQWVAHAVHTIAASVASSYPLFELTSKKKTRKATLEDYTDKLMHPNLHQTGMELIYGSVANILLTGAAHIQPIMNRKGELHSAYLIPTVTLTPLPWVDKDNVLHIAYVQDLGGNDIRVFMEEELVTIRMPNPRGLLYGKCTFLPLVKDIVTDINAGKTIAKFLEGGITAGMILKMEGDVDVVRRNKEWLKDEYSGYKNAGKPMLFQGPVEVVADGKKFGTDTINYERLREVQRDIIFGCAGIPISQAGLRSAQGQANQEVINAEEQAFLRNTVRFFQDLVYGGLTHKLFRTTLNMPDVTMKAGMNNQFSLKDSIEAAKAAGEVAVKVNEHRALLGLPPVENEEVGNLYVLNTNNGVVPAGDVLGFDPNTGKKVPRLIDQQMAIAAQGSGSTGGTSHAKNGPSQFANPSGGATPKLKKVTKVVKPVAKKPAKKEAK